MQFSENVCDQTSLEFLNRKIAGLMSAIKVNKMTDIKNVFDIAAKYVLRWYVSQHV